jgi:multimeric flavodoxin WrbA
MNPRDFVEIKYGQWWEQVSQKATKKKHARNIRACLGAVDYHNQEKRPLNVLLIHGSGRSSFSSAAQELSNSQLLLRSAVEPFRGNPGYEITEIALREYNVEPCEGCYSTSSALCGFPCNCFPWDPMQELYPLVLKCDVMLCSTGVNQSAMSTRLKTFLDRLISLDGGFFVGADQYEQKGPEWRDKCIALAARLSSTGQLHYDARMWGRVAAYFITSKDEKNSVRTVVRNFKTPLSYIELVAQSLRDGNADYGFFHAPRHWYAGAWADPDEELCHDKQYFSSHPKFLKRAKIVVKAAIDLAQKLRINPIPFDGGARTNRT